MSQTSDEYLILIREVICSVSPRLFLRALPEAVIHIENLTQKPPLP